MDNATEERGTWKRGFALFPTTINGRTIWLRTYFYRVWPSYEPYGMIDHVEYASDCLFDESTALGRKENMAPDILQKQRGTTVGFSSVLAQFRRLLSWRK